MAKTVLITGAQGNIGKKLQAHLKDRFTLRLVDINPGGNQEVEVVDLSRWDEELVERFSGVDAIVHLAADPYESRSWKELIAPNLDALNNLFIAAMKAKVPRVIYASSNHTMGGYQNAEGNARWLTSDLEPKPGTHFEWPEGNHRDSTPYGAMKLFGERLGMCYAQSTPAVCIALRIGWVNAIGENRPDDLPEEAIIWFKRMWLSTRDLCQLVEKAITTPQAPGSFFVVNGMSDNDGMVWDLAHTREVLGYTPQDGMTLDLKDKNRVGVSKPVK